ncbi:general transcriptional corepressor trfA-like isoform X2 [Plodia interpunctella]|uniref:general transcriptional corepressor trfA-like isoform X2 n=1 Tax=Plodia interpunctella TaxID=58824 RepID=UPI002367D855|nr:general transcriptional corepressor trfA-like isoform X2 [Plodia interpunctella]
MRGGNWSAVCCRHLCAIMRLICFWCFIVMVAGQEGDFYAPQTFKQRVQGPLFSPAEPWAEAREQARWTKVEPHRGGLFSPNDVTPESTIVDWRPKVAPVFEPWGDAGQSPRAEPWRLPHSATKERQAAIIHHKQALSSEGSFQYEYASENGLAAREQIRPDGSRRGRYQYRDPRGQLVSVLYSAGREGFQILEGSHLPKQPEPIPPLNQDQHHVQAYEQQKQQYEIQQQYNQQKPEQQSWIQNQQQQTYEGSRPQQQVYQQNNWGQGQEDDGQYRENDVYNKGPHTFGEGYSFAFKG